MNQFILWLNENPLWIVILAGILANLGKIITFARYILEKVLPNVFKVQTARIKIEQQERGAMTKLLQEFLDQEQKERKQEREQYTQMLAGFAQQNATIATRVTIVLEENNKQRSSVIAALMTVASGQRESAERTDRLYTLFDELASEVRPLLVCERKDNPTDSRVAHLP